MAAAWFRLISCLLLLGLADVLGAGSPSGPQRFRGGKVEWARLQTSSRFWNRHSEYDPVYLAFLRRVTSLDIEPKWQSVRATSAADLSVYPFIYSDSIASLSPAEARHLAEYLRRGGFLFIDACGNTTINPDMAVFFRNQFKILSAEFPDLRAEEIPPTHEVYSIYFKMTVFPPHSDEDKPRPMRAVLAGDRVIAVVAFNGFQCAWDGHTNEAHATASAQMVTNIYVFAMTR